MLKTAREYVGDNLFEPPNFDDVDLTTFLKQYLWVIFVSGFRNAVVEKHFAAILSAFHDLHLGKIAAMDAIDAATLPIAHQRKASAFLKGCKQIHAEGWPTLKADTWLKQCAEACSSTVDEMVSYLSCEYRLTRWQVDGYLWRYCLENQRVP